METSQPRDYKSLNSPAERQALIENIKRTRAEVLRLIEFVPHDQWYQLRYHGWSPAAMLGHLHMMDNITLLLMQAGMRGLSMPLPLGMLNIFNNLTSRFMRQQNIDETIHAIRQNESRLISFVVRLPAEKFNKKVHDPALERWLTIEEAVQEFFYLHWADHLQTMRQVDDRGFYEPAAHTTL